MLADIKAKKEQAEKDEQEKARKQEL